MKELCVGLAILLLLLFSAVNLFIPYALVVLGLFIGLGFICQVIKKSSKKECPLGFC
jgi:hypothetical protein